MILVLDIGNTEVTFGLYDQGWKDTWRLKTADEIQQKLPRALKRHVTANVESIGISSVVPFLTDILSSQVAKVYGVTPFHIGPEAYKHLPIEVLRPQQIGTDLVANAVAAFEKFQENCVVVDFGTALTFTVVNDKKIQGVNILPGIKTAMSALTSKTVKLQDIPLELPDSVIGTDTTTAIQSGILWGYVGLVERMIDRIEDEVGQKLKIAATGGLSKVLDPLESRFDSVDKNLTLEGIRLIREYNQ